MEASRILGGGRRSGKRLGLLALAIHCVLMFFASSAQAWWHKDWSLRRQIDLNTTAQGANIQETVSNVPLLLRLHSGNFDFKKAKADGSDLRLVAADDQTTLKYEIDTFDVINEIALIWVKIPEIKANAADNHIFLYFGNEKATDSQDKIGVYAQGQVLVYHLGEAQGNPQDSTQHKSHANRFSGGQSLPSVVGNGVAFFGGQDGIVVPSSPATTLTDGFSFSCWIKLSQPSTDGYLLSQIEQDKGLIVGINGDKVYARIMAGANVIQAEGATPLSLGNWQFLTVSAKAGEKMTIFLNGQEIGNTALATTLPALKTDLFIGGAQKEGHQLSVELDEIELSNVPRSPAYIATVYASQGIEGKLISFGAELSDEGGGGGEFYLGTITANITIDGWVIICLLIVMGSASFLVLVSKSYFLHLSRRENNSFKDVFTEMEAVLYPEENIEEYDNSPLCRIYTAGCATIATMLRKKGEEATMLSSKEIDYFKASLERSYLQETKRLQSWVMILPMAISGGPFLGLLGTVWGVMNTFAAMAHSGDANIMAIAPGVASALAATVCGLLVAIPCLFGYNFLSGQIKDLTAEIGIFIDEFIMRVDRDHGEA